MDDEDDIIIIEESNQIVEIEPSPWHNSDTVAASFTFAAQIAQAAAVHFSNLSLLALGQSVREWHQQEKQDFAEEAGIEIHLLTNDSGDGGVA